MDIVCGKNQNLADKLENFGEIKMNNEVKETKVSINF